MVKPVSPKYEHNMVYKYRWLNQALDDLDEVSGTGTYVYHAPQGSFYYTIDNHSHEVSFTVDGPVMRVALPGNPNAVFIRQ